MMKIFLLDLWDDLREKRLWPVAVAFVVALVAIPVVMLKPAAEGGDPAAAPLPGETAAVAAPTEAEQAIVRLAGETIGAGGSALDLFEPRDPFRGPRVEVPGNSAEEGPATAPAGGEEKPAAGSTGSESAPAGGGGSAGGESGGGSTGGGTTPPATGKKPSERVSYTYTADVRFGRDGSVRRYAGIQRMDVLPRTGTPILVFLGVTTTAKSAIFLVDSTLEQHGDGRCEPTPDECTFLYLTTERGHDLHFFTTPDGREYSIRLSDIQKERSDVVAHRAKAARKREARRARTSHGERETRRPKFFFPLFAGDEEANG